jgi:hypothetical protein
MCPTEKHHFFEGFEINEAQKQVHYLLIDLILTGRHHLKKRLHLEALNRFA